MKICSKCKIEKYESEFRIRKDRPCGFRSQCRDCDKLYDKSKNGKLSSKKYRLSLKGKLTNLKKVRKHQKTIRGKQTRLRYSQSYKGKLSHQKCHARRRDKKMGLDIKLTLKDVQLIYKRFNNHCFNCKSTDDLEIDHHYPLSRGYGLTLNNAVLLCRSCNSSKYNKMPEEFYTSEQLIRLFSILKSH